jgi:hypothetical protein
VVRQLTYIHSNVDVSLQNHECLGTVQVQTLILVKHWGAALLGDAWKDSQTLVMLICI